MPTIRFARWAAVSTKGQATSDKVSLPLQLEKTLETALRKGWEETAGPYVVPGESRTSHINLRDAEEAIPELRQMLDDAKAGKYDVLVMYDYDRLRDLLDPVSRALADYGVQIYDMHLGIEPQDPAEFSPYDETAQIGQMFGSLKSRSQINAIQRHFHDKMPLRITVKRLHAGLGRPPYGYRKPPGRELDKNAVLVPVPSEVRVLVQIKDWFFEGVSLTEIASRLNAQNVPSPRGKKWWYSVVAYLLTNPFYAGIVSFGITRRRRDRRNGGIVRVKSQPVTAIGKHSPVWDEATHKRILQRMEERGQGFGGFTTRRLSRILTCGDCGGTMWAQVIKGGYHYWRCSSQKKGHVYISDADVLPLVIDAIVDAVRHVDDLKLPSPEDKRPALDAELRELETRRKRWMDLFEQGSLEAADFTDRVHSLDERITAVQRQIADIADGINNLAATRAAVENLAQAIDQLPHYLLTQPPSQVNAELHDLFGKITITHDRKVILGWRV